MTLIKEVASELLGMFLADYRLTIATLLLVAVLAGLMLGLGLNATIGGGLLLLGCVVIVVEAPVREARRRSRM